MCKLRSSKLTQCDFRAELSQAAVNGAKENHRQLTRWRRRHAPAEAAIHAAAYNRLNTWVGGRVSNS
jgi:hypothetical protein